MGLEGLYAWGVFRQLTDGWGCDPTWIVVYPGAPQQLADVWGQIFPKWPPPEKGMLLNILESFAFNILSSQQATFPLFSQDVLQELQSGLTQIPMEPLLCPGTQYT